MSTKIHPRFGLFFALWPVVLCAQNVTAPAQPAAQPAQRTAAVANAGFPARVDAQASWQAKQPPENLESQTAKGPPTSPDGYRPRTTGAGAVAAPPLPSPKIDYFKEATERVSPMKPAQIRKFNDEMYESMLESSRAPGGDYVSRGPRMVRVNLSPGAKPEKVDIAWGKGTKISFVDRTGAKLIVDSVEGFSKAFSVRVMDTETTKKEGSHNFSLEAQLPTGQGNVAVELVGLNSPFVFDVNVGKGKEVDSHVQFVMPIVSPNRAVLPGERQVADATFNLPEMNGFLAGIPPEGAVEVKVQRVSDTMAWMYNNRLYLRTPHTVNAAWFKRQGSADGMAIYELPLSPIISLSAEGREVRAVLDYPYIPPMSKTSQ